MSEELQKDVTLTLEYVEGIALYDVDANMFKPFDQRILGTVDAVKCDGEYYLIPEGSDDLAKVVVEDNLVAEYTVLGTQGMIDKYLTDLKPEVV